MYNVEELQAVLDAAKWEHAQSIRAALLQAKIKIMAEEIFPAHHILQEAIQ